MKTVQISAIAALIMLADSANAQSTAQPTYYPSAGSGSGRRTHHATELVAFNTTAAPAEEVCAGARCCISLQL
jgi:hypothetical protein